MPDHDGETVLDRLRRSLLEPSGELEASYDRRRAQLLLAMNLSLLLLLGVVLGFEVLQGGLGVNPGDPLSVVTLVLLMAVAVSHRLGRTVRYERGAVVTIAVTAGLVLFFTFVGSGGTDATDPTLVILLMTIPILLGGLFLGTRAAFLIAGGSVGAAALLPVVRPEAVSVTNPVLIMILLAVPLLVSTRLQRRDLQQIHEQSRQLVESEERFRQIAENLESVVWVTSPDGGVLHYVNPAVEDVFGRPREVFREDPWAWDQDVVEEDRPVVDEALGAAPGSRLDLEFRMRPPDGETRWIWARSFPIRDDQGELQRMLAIAEDVTDRRRLERERTQLAEERARIEELERMTFAASHNLEEPLRNVASFVQLLDQRYRDELDDDARDYIRFAVEGVHRMDAVVDALRTYAEVTSRRRVEEVVDLDVLAHRVHRELQEEMGRTGEVKVERMPPVRGDPDLLRVLLHELLDNALRFQDGDGARVQVRGELRDGRVRVRVEDDGPGIHPDHQERVLQLFQQLERTDDGSVGLGLALADRIVERHGGELRIESGSGTGTTVLLDLPAADGDGAPSAPTAERPPASSGGHEDPASEA